MPHMRADIGRPMAAIAYILVIAMLGTTLPTPLYPTYERLLGFGSLVETVVFATYAVGVLLTLIVLGRSSDVVGRRPILAGAIIVAGSSAVVFVVVSNLTGTTGIAVLLFGRFLSGLSGGLATGCAVAALTDLAPPEKRGRASLIAAMAQMGGLGLGPLLGGVLAERIGDPVRTVFMVYFGLVLLAAVAWMAVPETVVRDNHGSMRRMFTPIPIGAIRARADLTGLTGFMGFAVLGLFASISPALLERMGWHSTTSTGLVVFSVFAASALGQLLTMNISTPRARLFGLGALMLGTVGVGAALHVESIPLLVAAGVVTGLGQGMSFRAALAAVTAESPPARRGEATSGFFVICYLGISVPVVGMGALTSLIGLTGAGEVFALVIALLAVFVLIVVGMSHRGAVEPADDRRVTRR